MTQRAKIKCGAFTKAIKQELLTKKAFADLMGTHKSRLSQLSSKDSEVYCSVTYVKRILGVFRNKYAFDDLFYWVNKNKGGKG